jgi:hypothetical protein
VLQAADHPGQGQQPLGVRALMHDHPAGAGGQQPRGLAVVAQALDRLGGDHDLDADVTDALGQVDRAVHPRGEGAELVQDEQGVLSLSGLAAGGVVAVVLQHHPHGRIRLRLRQERGHGQDGQVDVLVGPRPAVEGTSEGGEEVGIAQPSAGQVLADSLDVLQLQRPAFPQGGEFIDVQAAQQFVAALDRWHVGGGQGQPQAGGGDPLVERLGELLDREQAALNLGRGAAPHVHRLLGPAADAGAGVAEPVGGDQGRHQGGVGALAVGEASFATRPGREVGEPEEGDGLAGPGGADHGHGLAPQLGRRDHIAALPPAA